MANWCYNSEYICGPKNEISGLYRKLTEWTEKNYTENGFGEGWLGNIVGFAGFKRSDEIPEKEGGLPCPGWITEIDKNNRFMVEFEPKGNTGEIHFTSETAWGPMPEMWYKILKKYAPNCRYYYFSEEPSMAVYESNDTDHKYFSEETVIDGYFDVPEKLPEKILKYFPADTWFKNYDYSVKEIKEALQDKLIREFNNKNNEFFGDKNNTMYISQVIYRKEE